MALPLFGSVLNTLPRRAVVVRRREECDSTRRRTCPTSRRTRCDGIRPPDQRGLVPFFGALQVGHRLGLGSPSLDALEHEEQVVHSGTGSDRSHLPAVAKPAGSRAPKGESARAHPRKAAGNRQGRVNGQPSGRQRQASRQRPSGARLDSKEPEGDAWFDEGREVLFAGADPGGCESCSAWPLSTGSRSVALPGRSCSATRLDVQSGRHEAGKVSQDDELPRQVSPS